MPAIQQNDLPCRNKSADYNLYRRKFQDLVSDRIPVEPGLHSQCNHIQYRQYNDRKLGIVHKLKTKLLTSLCKQWDVLKHGPKDSNGKFSAGKNFADSTKCISSRYSKSAKNVCSAIINQAVSKHKKGNKKVFENIYYYKSVKKASKIKKESDKKNYVIKSYGILNLTKYLKPGDNNKLKTVVNNAGNANIKKVVEGWK